MKKAIILNPRSATIQEAWYEHWDVIEVPEPQPNELGICYKTMDALLLHCQAKNFELLLLPNFESLGFSDFMLGQIIECVIQAKAEIHTLTEHITLHNSQQRLHKELPTLSTLKAYRGRWHKVHFELRFRRGMPSMRYVPESHRAVTDEHGEDIGLELNPETQQKWSDLATLILEQHSWKEIGRRMYRDYGYTNPDGKPYSARYYEVMVYTPGFWGHSSMGFKSHRFGAWVYQEGETIPEGVIIHYNTHAPVWGGKRGEKIKEELRRRFEIDLDEGLPSEILEGHLICAECMNPLKMYVDGMWLVWRCKTHSHHSSPVLRDRTALKYLKKRIHELVNSLNIDKLLPRRTNEIDNLHRAIESTQQYINKIAPIPNSLYEHLADVSGNILEQAYMEMVILAELALESLQENQSSLEHQITLHQLRKALNDNDVNAETLLEESFERFWRLPPKTVNHLLSRLMAEQKFVVLDGAIVGVSR
jgi:hypothetical protein